MTLYQQPRDVAAFAAYLAGHLNPATIARVGYVEAHGDVLDFYDANGCDVLATVYEDGAVETFVGAA